MGAAPAAIESLPGRSQPSGPRRILVYQTLLVVALFALWEVLVRTKVLPVYLYGQPSGILAKLQTQLADGELLSHIGATAFASIVGFLVGTTLGSVTGLLLWLSQTAALVLRPVFNFTS